jgi:hypothetical protein
MMEDGRRSVMKVSLGMMNGATSVAPDYSMLKAALVAAQAATPTSQANRVPTPAMVDPHMALHALFSEKTDLPSPAAALGHRFSSDVPENEDRA